MSDMKEKINFPWKSILAILVVFGLLFTGFALWRPGKLAYYNYVLRSDNGAARVAAVEALLAMGAEGRRALDGYLGARTDTDFLAGVWKDKPAHDAPRTCLHAAVAYRFSSDRAFEKAVGLLAAKGWDLGSAKNDYGQTPLHDAALDGHIGKARVLINMGADINAKGMYGSTPLHNAVTNGRIFMTRFLVQMGADLNARDREGRTPLHDAASEGNAEIAALLAKSGANLDARNREGETPLHTAAEYKHIGAMKLLLSAGADVNAAAADGRTPLDYCWLHPKAARLLKSYGAKFTGK